MTSRFATTTLTKTRCLFAMFFVPVVVLHLAWITPLVEWSCFCPEDEPNYGCCCNCPKCVKNRGGFKSFCHLRPKQIETSEAAQRSSVVGLISGQDNAELFDNPHGLRQLSVCQCDSHIKKISLDIQPFLPQILTHFVRTFPVVRSIPPDDWRPPEAIPCQPHPPG